MAKLAKKRRLVPYVLDGKQAILDYKNIYLRKSKIWHFSKGVSQVHGFGPKFVFFGQIGSEKGAVLDRKKAILDFKNFSLRKTKIWHFPKGVSP